MRTHQIPTGSCAFALFRYKMRTPPAGATASFLRAAILATVCLASSAQNLSTCADAVAKDDSIDNSCPSMDATHPGTSYDGDPETYTWKVYNSTSCGTTECAAAIGSINNTALSAMRTGLASCNATVIQCVPHTDICFTTGGKTDLNGLPNSDSLGRNPNPFTTVVGNYASGYYYKLLSRAVKCGFNATVMKATLPVAPNTCEGAAVMWKIIHDACPEGWVGATYDITDNNMTLGTVFRPAGSKLYTDKYRRTPASCGTAACAAAISSIDNDAAMSAIRTGLTACAALPDADKLKWYGIYSNPDQGLFLGQIAK